MSRKHNRLKDMQLHHKLFFSFLGITGVILVWRGIWTFFDETPIISNPIISLAVGLILVAFSGVFYKKL